MTRVTPKKGKAKDVVVNLNIAECPSLMTATMRFASTRAMTQVRVYSKTPIRGEDLTMPGKLAPAVKAGKGAGQLVMTGLTTKKTIPLVAGSNGELVAKDGIKVTSRKGKVKISGITGEWGIVELTMYAPRSKALSALTGKKAMRFSAAVQVDRAPTQRLVTIVKPTRKR